MANTAFTSTSALNQTTFNTAFSDVPLIATPSSTCADNWRVSVLGIALGSKTSTGFNATFQLFVNQRTTYWQYPGNGLGGSFPTTNTASFTTCALAKIYHQSNGLYFINYDQFFGCPMITNVKYSTADNSLSAITSVQAVALSSGYIRISTYAGGTLTNVGSTIGLTFDLLCIGKAV